MTDARQVRDLTLAGARRVVRAAQDHADGLGVAVAVAVVDRAGHLVCFERGDGTPLLSLDFAVDKAWTAAAFGVATAEWWGLLGDDEALKRGLAARPRFTLVGGGVPLVVGGEVVGGVGVSGATADQDDDCARAGAGAVG